jgi:hypothetical protein
MDDAILDSTILEFFEGMYTKLAIYWDDYISDATALCAIFMLLTFAIKSYEMMMGQKRLDLLPLFRPFALLMVVLYWSTFVEIVAYPGQLVAAKAKSAYELNITEVDNLSSTRRQLINKTLERITKNSYAVEETKKLSEDASLYDRASGAISEAWEGMTQSLFSSFALIKSELNFMLGRLIEFVVLCLFRVMVYLVFFIQIIYSSILIILGPFSFAISILPAFRDSFSTWIARYISVSLYSGIAYIVLNIVMALIRYSLEQEISRLNHLAGVDEQAFMKWTMFAPGLMGYYMIGLLVGGAVMLSVPSISTWIVSSSGINSAVGTSGRAAASGAASAAKAGAKAVGL